MTHRPCCFAGRSKRDRRRYAGGMFRPFRTRVYGGGPSLPRALPWADLCGPFRAKFPNSTTSRHARRVSVRCLSGGVVIVEECQIFELSIGSKELS